VKPYSHHGFKFGSSFLSNPCIDEFFLLSARSDSALDQIRVEG
jgi:hypothetical protein